MDQNNSHTTTGASSAADFQPPTQNPQNNVGGGLQPGSTALQPTSTSNGSNIFNQPGINPQAFPQTSTLQVIDTTSPGLATGATEISAGFPWVYLGIIVVLLVGGILLLAKFFRNSENEKAEEVTVTEIPKPASVKTKSKSRKKSKTKKKKKSKK